MTSSYLERVVLLTLHDVEDERGEDVEALAVADRLVPACVRQQHAFEQCSFLVVLVAAEAATARAVQVLTHTTAAASATMASSMVVVGVRAYIRRYAGGLSEMNQRCTCIMTQQRHVWLMSVITGSKCSFIGDPLQ